MKKALVIIPTYNEHENIGILIERIIDQKTLDLDILVIDDNSADGTANIVKIFSNTNKNIFLIERKGKLGIGSAHIDGLRWAYRHEYQKAITMDSDLTHDPKDIKKLLAKSASVDLVIASRYLSKNTMRNWKFVRVMMTRLSHFVVSLILRKNYDASNGFRLYNLKSIPENFLDKVHSVNYSFFFESLYILLINGYKVAEVPTILYARFAGSSKMRITDIFKALKVYFWFFWVDKTGVAKEKYLLKHD